MYNYNKQTAFSYKLESAVDALPLTVADVKAYLRVDTSEDDDLIEQLIKTASLCCENYTRRVLISKTFKTYRNSWLDSFVLRKSPFQSVTSIKYYDNDNVLQTLDSENYYMQDEPDYYSIVQWATTAILPSHYYRKQAIEIIFVAGYGDSADDIPEDLKLAMKQHIATMYENRGDCTDSACSNLLPSTAKYIYNQYKITEIGGYYGC